MKNVILRLAGGCLCFVATATYAQRSEQNAAFASFRNLSLVTETPSARPTSGYLNNISTRAMRDFNHTYKEAVDTRWFVLKDGYTATCTLNNIPASMVYDRRGNWVYTIEYQKERDMPSDVRRVVKSTYYDYSISQVEKINYRRMEPIYWVHLQDAQTLKIVKVTDGVMEVMEDYQKSK